MCIRDRGQVVKRDDLQIGQVGRKDRGLVDDGGHDLAVMQDHQGGVVAFLPVSYTHLRAHETVLDLVCRLLLEKKKTTQTHDALSLV